VVKLPSKVERMLRLLLLSLLTACFGISVSAQETWTLDRCIRTGLEANLSIQSADLNVESALLEKNRWTYAMLPTVNANMSYGYQFGRTIDPTSNTFIEATTNFSNGQVNASLVVFDGFRIQNSRKQAGLNALASRATAEDVRNNAALQIATAYINILFAEEQMETSKRQSDVSREQLAQVERLVSAGVRPDNDRLVIVSQLAQNEYQVTLQQNAVDQAYLAIKQLMMVDPATKMRIDRPDFDPEALENPLALNAQSIYNIALQTQPVVRAAQLQLDATEKSDDIARAGLMPSLRLFGGLSSAYSNNFLDYSNPDLSNVTLVPGTPQPVLIDGENKLLTTYSIEGISFPALSFTDQLERNFGKNVGVSLQVPIYNNHTSRIAVQQARINQEQARINSEQVRQQMKSTVEGAVLSSRAARQQYLAAREALDAQRAAFAAVSKRFELGAANPVEFATAKANLDIAENQWIMGKYEYLFRIKVLDFYQGKPLTLN
jgi:outer membrane protein